MHLAFNSSNKGVNVTLLAVAQNISDNLYYLVLMHYQNNIVNRLIYIYIFDIEAVEIFFQNSNGCPPFTSY